MRRANLLRLRNSTCSHKIWPVLAWAYSISLEGKQWQTTEAKHHMNREYKGTFSNCFLLIFPLKIFSSNVKSVQCNVYRNLISLFRTAALMQNSLTHYNISQVQCLCSHGSEYEAHVYSLFYTSSKIPRNCYVLYWFRQLFISCTLVNANSLLPHRQRRTRGSTVLCEWQRGKVKVDGNICDKLCNLFCARTTVALWGNKETFSTVNPYMIRHNTTLFGTWLVHKLWSACLLWCHRV
jgi:hypothetical protein